ncbi:FHA domain-containing protein [Rhodobacteraceae bacterium B1Z28]|uniref:FHA domain-containing protein n=2 Tax=Ruegeria haliotis TaxID=2747601 RepID=A0ABX2PQH4_9RHOB|nr:FHA domain-containing protein [Ruegeria haliotis]
MFKYKSPLSRLLEGAGKAKEADAADSTEPAEDKPEPIADFNALREALAGGNMTSEPYEETDELIPEDKMPDFAEGEAAETEEPIEESIFADDSAVEEETATEIPTVAPEQETDNDEQVVTLHLTGENAVEGETSTEPQESAVTEPEVIAEDIVETPVRTPESQPEPVIQPEAEQAAPAPVEDRRSRVKTTFLGFERADTHAQDLIETAEPVAKTEAAQETFPVGWLVITGGPGRGASITLTEGLMQIGRNDDQAIQLDFGDTGISRASHAVIAYDPEDRKCYLGHGGKANLVRLNGKPVLSTVALSNGDLVRISETSIRFTAFCDDGFDWRDS